MDDDLQDNCRAVLLSGAGALTERRFLADYRELVDAPFPLRGRSLTDVLRSLGGFYFSKRNGETVISAAPDEKTAHLASLIARTRKKTKAPRGRRPQYVRSRLPPPRPLFRHSPPRQAPAWQAQPAKPKMPPVSVTPPKAKLANPPIIPQRQSLSVQNRLSVISNKDEQNHAAKNGFVPKLAEGTKEKIVREQPEPAICGPKTPEKVALEDEEEEATFVDIQWLQGRIRPQTIPAAPASAAVSLASSSASSAGPAKEISVSEPVKKKTPQVVLCSIYAEELSKLIQTLGLGEPEYKFIERKPLKSKPVFVAKLKIGSEIFSSFPFESTLKEEAQEHVAKVAINNLKARVQENHFVQEEVDEAQILNRLYMLLVEKQNGVFDAALASLYKEQFNCVLPEGWLKFLEKSPLFSVERHGEQRNIVYPRNKPDVSNGLILCKDINENIERPSFPCNNLKLPPKIILPQEDTWDVYVAYVSPEGVWVRLIGDDYDKQYDEIINDLEIKMLSCSDQPVNPEVGKVYAVKLESCWLRAELRDIRPSSGNEDDLGLVFLIDHGEEDEVPLKDLRALSEEFLDLPPQAVKCQLMYVDVSFEEAQTYLVNYVIGKIFVASIAEYQCNEPPLIILYNTDVEGDAPPINVNVNVLEQVVQKLQPPVVQVKSKELEYLENILIQLSNQDLLKIHGVNAHPKPVHLDAQNEHVFIVKSAFAPKVWRRAVLCDKGSQAHHTVTVHYIDHGYKEEVKFSNVFDVEKVLPPLGKYPKQAVQIPLDHISSEQMNKGRVQRFRKLAPPDSFIIGRIVDSGAVELMLKVQPNDMILSVSRDLINFQECSSLQESETEISSQESAPSLSEFPVNKLGTDFFAVTVTMTSNPFNFVVQPSGCEEYRNFNLLMKELQTVYEAQADVMRTPEMKDLLLNSPFAVKHPNDNQWYRVLIAGLVSPDLVSVRYCDFGDLGVVPRDQLRFLVDRFQEVPTMAIRARLHGVKPIDLDWSNDQSLYFKTLVESKSFMARVLDINSEPGFYTWRLSLQVIDVSKSVDIDLKELLIRENIAIAK